MGLHVFVLGLTLGGGLVLALWSLPPMRRITLSDRVAPYVSDTGTGSRLLAVESVGVTPWPTMERLLAPGLARIVGRMEPLLGNGSILARRLDRLGATTTVQQFRVEQLAWALVGAGAAMALSSVTVVGNALRLRRRSI